MLVTLGGQNVKCVLRCILVTLDVDYGMSPLLRLALPT